MIDGVGNGGIGPSSKLGKTKRRGSGSAPVAIEPRLEVSLLDPEKVLELVRQAEQRAKEAVDKSERAAVSETMRRMLQLRQTLKASPSVLLKIEQAIARIRDNGVTVYDRIAQLSMKRQHESFQKNLHAKRLKRRHAIRARIDGLKAKIAEREASTADDERSRLWRSIVRKQIPKAAKQLQSSAAAKAFNAKRVASVCSRETKRLWIRQNRQAKDSTTRARKAMREMLGFWKRNEREEKELRKRAEKEALEQRRLEEEQREARRQAKKLNFLLTQTELFTHFIAGKGGAASATKTTAQSAPAAIAAGVDFADVDDETLRAKAEQVALAAVERNREKLQQFQSGEEVNDRLDLSRAENTLSVLQPRMLQAQLKEYQLKGLGWLANLYEQGINGILADEMGLGKTIQAISLLAHLAESTGIWGPFLVVAPASTLHNWQQELARFVPAFRVLPYWGNVADRKTLRRFWPSSSKRPFTRDSTFHVLVTSYQLVVTDQAFLQKVRWQYMVLDEAQAIKSSASQRWKVLLGFPCRNRLLLTGTPIQNTMQELWALLHFIMPSLFDSHDEFSDWFSKDIESAAGESGGGGGKSASMSSGFDQHQLARLHTLLKPFMLRRVKRDVQSELAPKVEVEVPCELAPRQRRLYRAIKQRLPVAEILRTAASSSDAEASASLMNIMMQFRKVCNHPELFEREAITSPFVWHALGAISPKEEKGSGAILWPGPLRNPLEPALPRLVRRDCIQALPSLGFDISAPSETLVFYREKYTLPFDDLVPVSIRYLGEREPRCYVPAAVAPPVEPIPSSPIPALSECIAGGDQILMPDFTQSILGSGKMAKLDELLVKLKAEGHRVLIYNQMTRMIDLMEEYLQFRGYRYLRLDGATRIADRRDMVADWQANPDLFVFLLSTRAGGLGINLTAADTVVFYDSDWNPTVDQQAMDRAHRLGQTKQVTVYRLVTKGSVEERIQQRAKQKDLVQKVVIAGGDFDAGAEAGGPLKAKDIASLLLDDEE